MQDGLTTMESNAIDELLYVGVTDIASLRATLDLPWVQDDISETEYDILSGINDLGLSDEKAAAAVIGMEFLAVPDTTDALALRGMRRLGREGLLSALLGHPSYQDGITETETTLIAAVSTLGDAEEIGRALDPGYASIEAVSIGTEMTPGLKVSIIRTGTQSQPRTIDSVRDAVVFAEGVMQLPLPTDHVIIMLNDEAAVPGYAGTNYGFAISYKPEYEKQRDAEKWNILQAGLVHEVAHYYWRGNVGWIDEGMATLIEYIYRIEIGMDQWFLRNPRRDCEAHDLEMLSKWNPDTSNPRYKCNYYLGRAFFQELRESMGEAEFDERAAGVLFAVPHGTRGGRDSRH